MNHRVIPVLLLSDGGLVKTTQFKKPKYVGDPTNAIRIFNEKEVDELIVLDISASKSGKGPDYNTIDLFASECFMPLCYGGGISTLDQAEKIFDLGVEKVSLQSAALNDLSLVEKIANKYGSQSVVISLDIGKSFWGTKKLYNSATRKLEKLDYKAFLKDAVNAGAGEVVVNSIYNEGLREGYDLDLITEISSDISVPIVAMGGAGSLQDFRAAIDCGASAVAAGTFFVFSGPHKAVLISYPRPNEIREIFKRS